MLLTSWLTGLGQKLTGQFRRRRHRGTPRSYLRPPSWSECAASQVLVLEARMLLSAIWTGYGDDSNWSTAANWSGATGPNGTPGFEDDVVIGAGFGTIFHSADSDTVRSVTADSPLSLSGGTLDVTLTFTDAAGLSLAGGTLANATVSSDTTIRIDGSGTLAGVTINGDVDATQSANSYLYVTNGLTLNGTAYVGAADGSTVGTIFCNGIETLGGTGTIVFGG
ncbi:MAG: hypothetical protein JSS02_16280, partial [Planctomycetes bacterium]|nr:hypothetical protein [Planctomycetota bacterium]